MFLIFIIIILLILLFNFYTKANKLFMPNNIMKDKPNDAYELKIVDKAKDKELITWVFPLTGDESIISQLNNNQTPDLSNSPTILLCHGNSGNISDRNYMMELARLTKQNLILFDYSGYGKSKGIPSIEDLLIDGDLVFNHFFRDPLQSSQNLIVWGESLGGSVATYLTWKYQCFVKTLVLVGTFSSLDDVIFGVDNKSLWSRSILSNIYYNLPINNWLKSITIPVCIIHSIEDEIIPYDCALKNYDNVQSKNKLILSITGDHGTPVFQVKTLTQLFSFLSLSCNNLSECKRRICSLSLESWN